MSSPAVDQTPVEINFRASATTTRRIVKIAMSIPSILALLAIAVVIVLAFRRVGYPYELEWLESGMLEHVRRLVDGQPLYTQPTAEFTQYPYAPLTFGVGAVVGEIFGVHYWTMRAISIAATIVTFGLIYWLVRKETADNWAAVIATGIYAATYKLTGTWFDIGKADSLFIMLMLLAVILARKTETHKHAVIAGLVMALAVLTKQTAIFAFAPVAIYLMATRRTVGLTYLASGLVFGGGTTLVLNIMSHGWFDYYVWELLFQHSLITTSKLDFVTKDMHPFWPVLILIAFALPRLLRAKHLWMTGFYVFALGGFLAGAWSSRLHSGGADNVLMPAFLAMAIAAGIALGTVLRRPQRLGLIVGASVLCIMQLAFLRYDASDQVPTTLDRRTGDAFISWLSTVQGDVLVYSHPTYAVLSGHDAGVALGGSEDVMRGKNEKAKADFQASMAGAIHSRRYAAIILDGPDDTKGFPPDWQSFYVKLDGSAVRNTEAFRPIAIKTGQPADVYVPIGSTAVQLPPQVPIY